MAPWKPSEYLVANFPAGWQFSSMEYLNSSIFRGRPFCYFGPRHKILAFQAEVLGSIPGGVEKKVCFCPGFEPTTKG